MSERNEMRRTKEAQKNALRKDKRDGDNGPGNEAEKIKTKGHWRSVC